MYDTCNRLLFDQNYAQMNGLMMTPFTAPSNIGVSAPAYSTFSADTYINQTTPSNDKVVSNPAGDTFVTTAQGTPAYNDTGNVANLTSQDGVSYNIDGDSFTNSGANYAAQPYTINDFKNEINQNNA